MSVECNSIDIGYSSMVEFQCYCYHHQQMDLSGLVLDFMIEKLKGIFILGL